MENLDYDKYVKNQEVREALFLLKNKVDKDKENQEEPINDENKQEEDKNSENLEKNEEKEVNLPPIDPKIALIHDKEWDGKNLNDDSEYQKKKMADKILKLDKVKICLFILFL